MSNWYTGPVVLESKTTGTRVTLNAAKLRIHVDYPEHAYDRSGIPGTMTSWTGSARLPGMLLGLLDILGDECALTLPDGRTGTAFVTGFSEESAWVVEIQGTGPPPQ